MTTPSAQVTDELTGEEHGLWMVQVTVWVNADTATRAASKVRRHAEQLPDAWGADPMIDHVTGWDPQG